MLKNNIDELNYVKEIESFTEWCTENFLELNVNKTKEMVIDFRNKKTPITSIVINNEAVEVVSSYKYLGTVIDYKFNGTENSKLLYGKAVKRIHLHM